MAGQNHSAKRVAKELAIRATQLRDKLQIELDRGDRSLSNARDSLAADLGRGVTTAEAADVLAQAATCAAPILAHQEVSPAALSRLVAGLSDWERWALETADVGKLRTQYLVLCTQSNSTAAHLFEPVLQRLTPAVRKRHGVFLTPLPIAATIVRQIDQLLRDEFQLPEGIASHSALRAGHSALRAGHSALHFLDPACGTGVFLLEVIDHLHRSLGDRFAAFVPDLLPRLVGIELLPAAAFLAKLNIALKLAQSGYDFRDPDRIHIHCGDALSPAARSALRTPHSALPILLGNPPFSSLSANTNPWIARLVRGEGEIRGYVQAGDQRLGERKTWLHDDYVKFMRLAQWHVEQAGCGIVGYVTSHGYLDNATFRLMRHELLRVFPHIRLVDLHGGRKSGRSAPDGRRDENVFGLDQGVVIGLFSRPNEVCPPRIEYAELWGSRDEKLAALAGEIPAATLAPQPPDWRLIPSAGHAHPEYDAGWLLTDVMPVSTSAPVTARDQFVVAFTEEELCERLSQFRDLSIPDDDIRQRYFTRTRSSRYPPGDTRSWKLSEARRTLAADTDWRSHIRRCLYRPFDWRYVFWHPAMIDWPRTEVTRHLVSSKFKVQSSKSVSTLNFERETLNFCLIARRQQLPTQPCTFFWISDGLALDGVIRSDNRGSESLFPLWLLDDGGEVCPNFAPAFVAQVAEKIGAPPSPNDLLGYIYALFHSPTYRERYAHELRRNFPRIFLPANAGQFAELASFGRQLIDLHLLRSVGQESSCSGVTDSPALRDFRVGGYIVLRKWLQPKHRSPADPQFNQINTALACTIHLMAAIDHAINLA